MTYYVYLYLAQHIEKFGDIINCNNLNLGCTCSALKMNRGKNENELGLGAKMALKSTKMTPNSRLKGKKASALLNYTY